MMVPMMCDKLSRGEDARDAQQDAFVRGDGPLAYTLHSSTAFRIAPLVAHNFDSPVVRATLEKRKRTLAAWIGWFLNCE